MADVTLTDDEREALAAALDAHETKVRPGCWVCSCGYLLSFESRWNYVTPGTHKADELAAAVERIVAARLRVQAEQIATAIEAVDSVEWALAGMEAGMHAARIARDHAPKEGQ